MNTVVLILGSLITGVLVLVGVMSMLLYPVDPTEDNVKYFWAGFVFLILAFLFAIITKVLT